MKEKIVRHNLTEFIDNCEKSNIDFAKITDECMAKNFVKEVKDGAEKTYTYIEPFLDHSFTKMMRYEVLAIYNRCYLMYQVERKAITIWVCYTENGYRNRGYMTKLLIMLIKKHQKKIITVDTHNPRLRNICNTLGINLFR